MDEVTARTKWCPMVRGVLSYEGTAITNLGGVEPVQIDRITCIASDCMAWKWSESQESTALSGNMASRRGYCGLTR